MKRQGKTGFTMIEMLTVIVIIVLIAGILIPAVNKAFAKAKRATVSQDMASIKAAVDAYDAEYGHLPMPTGASRNQWVLNLQQLQATFAGLMSSTNAVKSGGKFYNQAPKNPLEFTFLEGSTLDDNGNFRDPWGQQYQIIFASKDGYIDLEPYYAQTSYLGPNKKIEARQYMNVVSRSLGPDKKVRTDDDLLSILTY